MASSESRRIRLHDGVAQPWFTIEEVCEHLARWLPWLPVEVGEDLLARSAQRAPDADFGQGESLASRLCQCRVRSPFSPPSPRRPLKPETDYEARLLSGTVRAAAGVTYDGNELQRLANAALPSEERCSDTVHIWFTERLIATWEEDDRRYHLRVIVSGHPAVVSTTGMVHAPARARDFYLARRLGVSEGRLQSVSEADYLQFEDHRAVEVAKGYAMQAAVFALAGEPFCQDPGCRLFNAHWQAEMLGAQLEGLDYCDCHQRMLERWAERGGA